jgi:pyruvate/2-oxoglutarate dehydrogenase complex dihydrolipoamide acyltransferase (E2) component
VGAAEETKVRVPLSLAFGMVEREKRMMFEHLPLLSADMSTRREMNALRRVNAEEMAAHHAGALAAGVRQANAMATLVDLRIANAAGIAFENRCRVIEVQGAYLLFYVLLCVLSPSWVLGREEAFSTVYCMPP